MQLLHSSSLNGLNKKSNISLVKRSDVLSKVRELRVWSAQHGRAPSCRNGLLLIKHLGHTSSLLLLYFFSSLFELYSGREREKMVKKRVRHSIYFVYASNFFRKGRKKNDSDQHMRWWWWWTSCFFVLVLYGGKSAAGLRNFGNVFFFSVAARAALVSLFF